MIFLAIFLHPPPSNLAFLYTSRDGTPPLLWALVKSPKILPRDILNWNKLHTDHICYLLSHCTDSTVSLCCCKLKYRGKDKQWMLTLLQRPENVNNFCRRIFPQKPSKSKQSALPAIWITSSRRLKESSKTKKKTNDTQTSGDAVYRQSLSFLLSLSGFGPMGLFVLVFTLRLGEDRLYFP